MTETDELADRFPPGRRVWHRGPRSETDGIVVETVGGRVKVRFAPYGDQDCDPDRLTLRPD